jgi:predicted site-specific integrase-resolvase
MKIINGKYYFTPMEANSMLGVCYKTLQRWVEGGGIPIKA